MSLVKHGLSELPGLVEELGGQRVLIVSGKSARFVARVRELLGERVQGVYDGARRHVPEQSVAEASQALEQAHADTLVSVGGGSATGLGKALRLDHRVHFIAIPTTYSGSERTNIYGTTRVVDGVSSKRTGRDEKVRPDAIIYDGELLLDMPKALTVTSLMNALAHAIAVLVAKGSEELARRRALGAAVVLFDTMEALVREPRDVGARERALSGAADAAELLSQGGLGTHHELVHELGGGHDVEHSALHSVLLPCTVHEARCKDPAALATLEQRLGVWDLEGQLFDLLRRAGAATALYELGISPAAFEQGSRARALPFDSAFRLAVLGRRPSRDVRHETLGAVSMVALFGPRLEDAHRVVFALHGRGSTAESILGSLRNVLGDDPGVCVVAPQARDRCWYEASYSAVDPERDRELDLAIEELEAIVRQVSERAPNAQLGLFGFSQGACVCFELLRREPDRFDVVVALSGARVHTVVPRPIERARRAPRLLVGASEGDAWARSREIATAAREFEHAGVVVVQVPVPGSTHTLHLAHRLLARELLLGVREEQCGLGNAFQSEALSGALPREQNSPRHAPFGLYAEQINGTGFGAERAKNLRTWMYRIRPPSQQSPYVPLEHATFDLSFASESVEPNLCGWAPQQPPEAATDFVDGIVTLGGSGDPSLRRGYAVHWFSLNRSMERRAFCNADGDLLLVLQSGELTLVTELGVLAIGPGCVAVLPRGLRFTVVLRSAWARGFLGEIFGRHFQLPERGLIGANGLADARHFRVPSAWFEDRLELDTHVVTKLGGRLFESRQDYSPFDVAAWHGNYVPFSYDLSRFSPVGNTRIDHGDPSVHTVLTSTLDETGSNLLDLVAFVPRWDSTEHTFRPPFFHRNATLEWNAVLRDRSSRRGQFEPGTCFLTPPMTPHGVRADGVERTLLRPEAIAEAPRRLADDSLWIQFESSLPMRLSRRATQSRILDWPTRWGAYRNHRRGEP
jgi:homogentisate 1,2-dioxygenase